MMKRSVNTFLAAAVMLLLTGVLAGAAAAQTPTITEGRVAVVAPPGHGGDLMITTEWMEGHGGIWDLSGLDQAQGPPEVRIFTDILKNSLAAVEPPELPAALKPEAAKEGEGGVARGLVMAEELVSSLYYTPGSRSVFFSGDREVSGFYMAGYGYLFTIRWPLRARSPFNVLGLSQSFERLRSQNENLQALLQEQAEARTRSETRERIQQQQAEVEQAARDEQQRLEERRAAEAAWQATYRDKMVAALKEVIATYGYTLRQAGAEENITLLAEFDGDDPQNTVTLSVRKNALRGPEAMAQTMNAIRVTGGDAEVNPRLKRQIEIMTGILDSSLLETSGEFTHYVVASSGSQRVYTGGTGRSQYVPGYGVIFRKNARLNWLSMAVTIPEPPAPPGVAGEERIVRERQTARAEIADIREKGSEAWAEHLDELKQKSAELLALYGPTLTELPAEEWVAFYFNVGSSVNLVQGGMDYFLVQARMRDIRTAAQQADGAAWLKERLVTNEKK